MGVLATTVPSAQNLFAIVGTQISSMLQPIERSCTDNGIETTVVAAMNDNDMLQSRIWKVHASMSGPIWRMFSSPALP